MSTETRDTCQMRVALGWSRESATGTAFVCALKEKSAMAKDCKAWGKRRPLYMGHYVLIYTMS